MSLLKLPSDVFDEIFSYFTYEEIARLRLVSKEMDRHCQRRLNYGFLITWKRYSSLLKSVKRSLPRRESQRRRHPMKLNYNVLIGIERNLGMLETTYMPFIDNEICSFIPGKVLDIILALLDAVRTDSIITETRQSMLELSDQTILAVEHFREQIQPNYIAKLNAKMEDECGATRLFRSLTPNPYDFLNYGRVTTFELTGKSTCKMMVNVLIQLEEDKRKLKSNIEKLEGISQNQSETIIKMTKELDECKQKLDMLMSKSA